MFIQQLFAANFAAQLNPPELQYNRQITDYFDTLRKSPFSIEKFGEEECTICLQKYEPNEAVVTLDCDDKHFFHGACALDWLKKKPECPLCRCNFRQKV